MESTSPQVPIPTQNKDNTSTDQSAKTAMNILQVDVSALRSDIDSLNQRFDQLDHNIKTATKAETDRRLTHFTKTVGQTLQENARSNFGKWARRHTAEGVKEALKEEDVKELISDWVNDSTEWIKECLVKMEETEKKARDLFEAVTKKIDEYQKEGGGLED